MSRSDEWKIERISTPKRIINKIKSRMDQPVGIVVVGIDCSFKENFATNLVLRLGDFASSSSKVRVPEHMKTAFEESKAVVVVMNSEESCSHEARHELVERMKRAGAKTMVMFYADANKYPTARSSTLTYAAAKFTNFNSLVDTMRCNAPTPGGVDYLITVSEDEV